MQVSIKRTSDAVTIKLPPTVDFSDIQYLLDYFSFQEAVSKSQATQEEIDVLAKEVKSGWWERNKHRFAGKEGFEEL